MQASKMLLAKAGHKNCFKCLQRAGTIISPQHKISFIPEFLFKEPWTLLDLTVS